MLLPLFKPRAPTIPLDRDATGRFLPYIIAALTLLATLMLVLAQGLTGALSSWRSELDGRATIQILPLDNSAAPLATRVELALSIARASPMVRSAEPIEPEKMQVLLEPWLGDQALPEDLPIPVLIDLQLASSTELAELKQSLAVVAGATLDDHGHWLDEVRQLAELGAGISLLLLAFILAATALMLILLVRAGLSTHRDVIELLHLVGATDAFIIRQFRRHMLMLAGQGALLGLLLAVLLLVLIERMALGAGFTVAIDWRLLPLVPSAFILLAVLTSQRVTQTRLNELP